MTQALGEKLRGPFQRFKNALTQAASKDGELGMIDDPSLTKIKHVREKWTLAEQAEYEFIDAINKAIIEACKEGVNLVLEKLEAAQ